MIPKTWFRLDLVEVEVHELRQSPNLLEVFHLDLHVPAVEGVNLNQRPQLLVKSESGAEPRLGYG